MRRRQSRPPATSRRRPAASRSQITSNAEVISHDFAAARRCRVFVAVHDRDVSNSAPWGAKTDERHTIIVWPTIIPRQRWTSAARDATAIAVLDGDRRVGIDPELGSESPENTQPAARTKALGQTCHLSGATEHPRVPPSAR